MNEDRVSLQGLDRDRPPVVLLGDIKLVRPLGMAGIPVILGTTDEADIALRSRHIVGHCVLPGFDERSMARSAEVLVAVGARLHRALGRRVPLIYGSDKHLELIFAHREALAAHYLFIVSDEDLAWSLHDKERFYPLCERVGVLVPKTLPRGADPSRALAGWTGPVLVKPRLKTDWRAIQRELFDGYAKARVFASAGDLLAHPAFQKYADALIVQQYVEGAVEDLCSFHGFTDEGGRLLAAFCGRKIRTYPDVAGESSFIEVVDDPELDAVGRDVVARLGLKGPFKIDLIRDRRTGRLYTLEINARFNLWHHLGAVHGVNVPAIAYDYLAHGRAPEVTARPRITGMRWASTYLDFQAFRERAARDGMNVWQWLSQVASPDTVHEAFAWHDPLPFVSWVLDYVRERRKGTTTALSTPAAGRAAPSADAAAPDERPGAGAAPC